MNIAVIYFSPTGNTAKIAQVIKENLVNLENTVELIDITYHSKRLTKIYIEKYDAFLFGFPIHYWRAPRLIRDWLKTLNGQGKRCSTFFTYGGVHVGSAHSDTISILAAQNFKVVSTAEFLAKHTYNIGGWHLLEDHPNINDFNISKEFTQKTYEKFLEKEVSEVEIESSRMTEEQLDKIETMTKRAIYTPFREGNECSMCKTCEEICPANAMDAEKGKPNRKLCIRCLSCIINCPDNVIKTKDMTPLFQMLMKLTKMNEEEIDQKKSKFYI